MEKIDKELTAQDRQRYAELNAIHQPTIDLLKEVYGTNVLSTQLAIELIRDAIELKLSEGK